MPASAGLSCYTLRCPAPFWLIQCKPYQNRFTFAKVIDKSSGARFCGPLCVYFYDDMRENDIYIFVPSDLDL